MGDGTVNDPEVDGNERSPNESPNVI